MKPRLRQLAPQPRRALGAAFLLLCSGLLLAPAAAQEPLRVAVVDAGGDYAVPPEVMELLVVRLSDQKDVAVLERQEIEAILREQERSLAITGDASADQLIAAGKILGADALIVLRAGAETGESIQPINADVVETRRGIRLGSTSLAWSTGGELSPDEQIADASKRLVSLLARLQSTRDFTMIALSGLSSGDKSQTAHRLRRDFEAGLRAWLAAQPGLAVVERTKVLPLIDERRIASDLPRKLGGADALIDGSFALDFAGESPQVQVTLRVTLRDGSIRTGSVATALDQASALRDRAGALVLELLDRHEATAFNSQAEANLLVEEIERLLKVERSVDGFQRAMTAYALAPDDPRVHRLLLSTSERFSFGYDLSGVHIETPYYPAAVLRAEAARKELDRIDRIPVDRSERGEEQRREELRHVSNLLRNASLRPGWGSNAQAADSTLHEWLRAERQDLFAQYLEISSRSGGIIYEEALACGLDGAVIWSSSLEEAFKQRLELLEQAAAVDEYDLDGWVITGSFFCDLDDNKAWSDHARNVELFEDYLRKLTQSENPVLRARGECETATFVFQVLKDRPRAMTHYAAFIDLVIREVIPLGGPLAKNVNGHWLSLNHSSGTLALTDDEIGDYWSRVLRARFDAGTPLPRGTQPWEYLISRTTDRLEKAGRVAEADDLLSAIIDRLGGVPTEAVAQASSEQRFDTAIRLQQLRDGLADRHAELRATRADGAVLHVKCDVQVTPDMIVAACKPAEDAPAKHWMFTGIVRTPTGYAVSCSYIDGMRHENNGKVTNHREWLAVARLDAQGRIETAAMFPRPLDSQAHATQTRHFTVSPAHPHCSLAAVDGSIFVGPPMQGILWFPPEGDPVQFTSEVVDAPDPARRPFPFDEVQRLFTMHGKLYAMTGHAVKLPAVHEFDYRNGAVSVVLDVGAIAPSSPLHGRGLAISFEAGPPGQMLIWAKANFPPRPVVMRPEMLRAGPPPREPSHDLLTMTLADHSIREVDRDIELALPWAIVEHPLRQGFQTEDGAIAVFSPQQLELEWLLGGDRHATEQGVNRPLQSIPLAANDRFVLATVRRPGFASGRDWNRPAEALPHDDRDVHADWVLYDRTTGRLHVLSDDDLPDGDKGWSFFLDDASGVIMTTKAIYRVQLPDAESQAAEPAVPGQ